LGSIEGAFFPFRSAHTPGEVRIVNASSSALVLISA
jgi:hypothetical protein